MNCPTERSVIRSIEKMWSTDCIAYGIRVRLDSFSSGCLRTIRLGLGHETSVSVACLFGVHNIEEHSPILVCGSNSFLNIPKGILCSPRDMVSS